MVAVTCWWVLRALRVSAGFDELWVWMVAMVAGCFRFVPGLRFAVFCGFGWLIWLDLVNLDTIVLCGVGIIQFMFLGWGCLLVRFAVCCVLVGFGAFSGLTGFCSTVFWAVWRYVGCFWVCFRVWYLQTLRVLGGC